MVDIARDPAILKRKRLRQGLSAATVLALVVAVSVALARMEPAAPTVERGTLIIGSVERASLVLETRGLGTLVPEDTRWIPALTDGRVERILLRAGAVVQPDSIIVELSSDQVQQDAINARIALQSAQASLEELRVRVQNDLLEQQTRVVAAESAYKQAQLDAESNQALAKDELVSTVILKKSLMTASTTKAQFEMEAKRLASVSTSTAARLSVQQAAVDSARAGAQLQETRLASLKVRPGFAGVLQQVPVEVGQRIAPGTNIARVADPLRLKAELKIPETQAKDVEIGQPAKIDTRNGIIAGRVSRKDPAAANGSVAIDVTLLEALPRGAVPDLSVDGTIQRDRLDNVLVTGRPTIGQEQSTVTLFRLRKGTNDADRVQVKFGRASVTRIEVLSGLREGDQVVLSDMSTMDAVDRIRLK